MEHTKTPGLRMNAYYYRFQPTGQREIDRVLSAVACAGKAFHHTESWGDEAQAYPGHVGSSPVECIQNAANDAANKLAAAREQAQVLAEYVGWSCDLISMSADMGNEKRIAAQEIAHQILFVAEPVTPARSEEKCNTCVGTGKELIDCAGSAGYRTCEQCEGTGRAAKKAARCTQGRSQGTGGKMTTDGDGVPTGCYFAAKKAGEK